MSQDAMSRADKYVSLRFNKLQEQRLDHFLAESLADYSRARLQALVKNGLVLVDGLPARKSGQMLAQGALVELHIPAAASSLIIPQDIPLDIVFENKDVLVVNKPAGVVVHPAAGHDAGTLVNAAIGHDPHMQGIGGEVRPGVVHRLDKDTSGLILLAKNDRSLRWLQDQFRERRALKTYLALVDGKPPTVRGRIEAAIGRDPSHRKRMSIRPEDRGRQAITEYKTLESFAKHTLLELHPLTGRTHQIRVHCAFLGCPIVGDRIYGWTNPSLSISRQFLHAHKLAVTLPDQDQRQEFEAALPDDLRRLLSALRKESAESAD